MEDKTTQDGVLVGDEPIQDGGFELFHRQDDLFLSPEEVLDLDPAPVVGNYWSRSLRREVCAKWHQFAQRNRPVRWSCPFG